MSNTPQGAKQAPPEQKSSKGGDKPKESKADSQAQAQEPSGNRFQKTKPKESGETEIYHVAPGVKLSHEGQLHQEGTELLLSESYAKSLGDAVRKGEAPKPDVVTERKAGKYRVASGHRMFVSGKLKGAGFVLELSADEAKSHGAAVEPV